MRIVSAKETEITHTNGSCCRRYQPVVLLFKWKFLRISCSLIVECIKMKFMDVIWLAPNDGFLLLIINQTMSGRAVKRYIIAIGLFCVILAFGTWLSIQQLIIALFMMRHNCNFFVSSIKRMMEQKPFLCNVLTTETGTLLFWERLNILSNLTPNFLFTKRQTMQPFIPTNAFQLATVC